MKRRSFLQIVATSTGAFILAVRLPRLAAAAGKPARAPQLYIRIDPDNRVTIFVPKSEMGQGVRTALALLVVEELEADWAQVVVETPALDARLLDQGTGGSSSVWLAFEPLRQVGAAMRIMLIAAAAARWKVPATRLHAEAGHVIDPETGHKAPFGELAGGALAQPVPAHPALKPRDQWKLLGKDHVGKDVADIVHGRARYGLDTRLPGMLFASIERPHAFGATVATYDAAAARAVPGVEHVIAIAPVAAGVTLPHARIAGGVAVVAKTTWAALEGRRHLAIRWTPGPYAGESTAAHRRDLEAALDRAGTEQILRIGDPDHVLSKAATVVRADYEVPFLAHATLEPMNCTAHWDGTQMTLWAPTQDPAEAQRAVTARLGLKLAAVTIHVTLMGGGFGRRLNVDYAVEAAVVAREVAAPVQVMWTREDDLGHDYYRPCARHRLEACFDSAGMPLALRHRLCDPAIGATYEGDGAKGLGAGETECISNSFYRVPHRKSEYTLLASGVPRGWWRAVTSTHAVFALECFIDELAAAAGKDPLAYRLALIDRAPELTPASLPEERFDPVRMKACLERVAERAGWGQPLPAGHGRGIACGALDHMSYAAVVIEASVESGRVIVHRAVCAFDCGIVIHPDGARAQVEGAITQAISAALHERITIADGGVVETNFHSYRLLRFNEAPRSIEVHFLDRPDVRATGLGEPALPPVAPALANALYRATGHRLRELPLRIPA